MRTYRAAGMLRRIAAIAGNDLRQQLRNGTLPLFGVVLPLGLALLFANLMGGDTELRGDFAVVDHDRGELSRTFTDEALPQFTEGTSFTVEHLDDEEVARARTDDGALDATFVIPAGFTEDLQAGRPVEVTVVGNVDASLSVQVAREIAEAYAAQLRSVQLATAVAASDDPTADPAALAQRAAQAPWPVELSFDPTLTVRELDSTTYSTAGMAVFFLFFTAMLSITSMLEERRSGTMARLIASPTPAPIILLGKLTATVLIGLAAMTVVVAASTLLFGADWGDLRGVAVLVVGIVLAATSLLAVLASFASTAERASNWMSVLAVLFGLFGGAFIPLAQLGALEPLSYATPHRWFLQGLSDLASGELSAVLAPFGVLILIAAVGFGATLLRLGKVIRP